MGSVTATTGSTEMELDRTQKWTVRPPDFGFKESHCLKPVKNSRPSPTILSEAGAIVRSAIPPHSGDGDGG